VLAVLVVEVVVDREQQPARRTVSSNVRTAASPAALGSAGTLSRR
jgi:hypothetical protein